jgi:iron complex outermembrane receptor protein
MDYEGWIKKDGFTAALRLEKDFSSTKLLSITSVRQDHTRGETDIDFRPIDLMRLYLGDNQTVYSQEVRLLSTDKTSPFQWLTGVYGFYGNSHYKSRLHMNMNNLGYGPFGVQYSRTKMDTDSTGLALFGQASYTFFDKLELTAGLRYDYINKSADYRQDNDLYTGMPNLNGSNTKGYTAWLPKFAASYKITDSMMPYVSVSRGFREGGFNKSENIGKEYEAEYTWNYEAGLKTTWFDNKLTANLAVFYIDWQDRQVEVITAGGSAYYMDNAGKAESRGVEIDIAARPFEGLELTGSFGYTHAEYKDYAPAPSLDYAGKRVIDSPEYTASLGATYRFQNGIFIGTAYNRVGKIYY